MNIRAKILLFLVFSYSIPLFSQRNEFQGKLKEIKSLIEADNIDFLKLKMTVDQLVFPNQDHNVHAQIEQMVSKISTLIRDGSSSSRIAAIRKYLYERGAWNDHQEYVYDLDDPMGTKLSGGILANYLSSRKGNCVSMPILFFIIAKKLDLDVSLSAAPEHVLMKFTDSETGRTFNVETTSGGHFARTAWLQSLRSITDAALKNGIYLSKLTDKESAAIMLMTLSQYYKGTKEYENVIRISDLALSFYPKFVHAMLSKGSAYPAYFMMGVKKEGSFSFNL